MGRKRESRAYDAVGMSAKAWCDRTRRRLQTIDDKLMEVGASWGEVDDGFVMRVDELRARLRELVQVDLAGLQEHLDEVAEAW